MVTVKAKELANGILENIRDFFEEKEIDTHMVGEERIRELVVDTLYRWGVIDGKDEDTARISTVVFAADIPEFIGQIIDFLEDFLEEKGITIPNPEKDEDPDDENTAIIYGTDYGNIAFCIEETLANAGAVEKRW